MKPGDKSPPLTKWAQSTISDEEFAASYHAATSLPALMQSLGWSKSTVLARVKALRRRGIVLPPLPRKLDSRQIEFITIWQAADSVAEAAARYGVLLKSAYKIAHHLRAKGYALKKFPTSISKTKSDPAPLLAMIDAE